MKEHSGGTPDVGYISLDKFESDSFSVPIQHFDYDRLDSPEDILIETVKAGGDVALVLRCIIERVSATKTASKMAALISIFLESQNPRMIAHQIVWATGMTLLDGAPITELAAKYGVTKQAFEQGAFRVCEKLDLRPCRNMRDKNARETMSKRNFRK